MKKITLILSAVLVSLSVLAAPTGKMVENQLSALKSQTSAILPTSDLQNIEASVVEEKANAIADFQVADLKVESAKVMKKASSFKAPAQVKDSSAFLALGQAGIGMAIPYFQFATGTENYLYVVGLVAPVNGQAKYIARFGYIPQKNLQGLSTDYVLYYAENTGYIDTTFFTIDSNFDYTLPDGVYLYEVMGYTVNEEGKVDSASVVADYAAKAFMINDDAFADAYPVKNLNVTVNTNNTLTMKWEAKKFPGAWFRILLLQNGARAFDSYGGSAVRHKIEDLEYTTPDSVALNGFYTIYTYLLDANGNVVNGATAYGTIGENANAATELSAVTNDEAMTATLSWKSSILKTAAGATIWNDVLITDTAGNTYLLNNGRDYVAALAEQSVTTEQLPVGKYSWSVLPNYETTTSLIYIAETKGEEFEIKDITAPVISGVEVVESSDTEVNLAITVTDNALNVTAADLVYNVKGDVVINNASLEADGTLKLSGLTSKLYNITITATDPSGNVSDEYEFAFTPIKDTEAPKNLKAEIEEGNIFDKYAIITVSAEDNVATAEQLTYILTFADGTVVEAKAQEGLIVLEDLTPETSYEITVTVKDFGGNVSTESVKLQFTTIELQPIELAFEAIYARYYENYKILFNTFYNFDADGNPIEFMNVAFTNITSATEISGKYSIADGSIQKGQNTGYSPDGKNKIVFETFDLELKYLTTQQVFSDGTKCGIYYVQFEGVGVDGNIYIGEFATYIYAFSDATQAQINPTETFKDTDAPLLWINDEDYVEVNGTTVEILFGALDGPFYFEKADPVQTELTNLILEVVDDNGNVLASQAAGTIANTPTLDEDGAYYFTATLTGLEANTEYTVYITAADEAGNEAEPIEVSFTTGDEAEGIENLSVDGKPQKVLRNGNLYIIRGTEIFNATGQRVAK